SPHESLRGSSGKARVSHNLGCDINVAARKPSWIVRQGTSFAHMTQALASQRERSNTWIAHMLTAIERQASLALAAFIMLYVAVLFFGLTFKYFNWAQGYDQIDYQQSIWNTTQGRFLEISHYRHTDHLWGMDFIPAILLIVPFYALFPSALTLNFFQALFMALGALPIYGIARDRFDGSRLAGLGWALVYLLYPSLWFVTMSAPWQPRTLAIPALLGAFFFLQRATFQRAGIREWGAYLGLLALALTTRTDVSLVVVSFGILAALWRVGWRWALPPLIMGLAWFYLSTNVIVPSFYLPDYQVREGEIGAVTEGDYTEVWPGKSPQLAYYSHLGDSAGAILWTIVSRPIDVLRLMFTPDKLVYLTLMLLPLALLPLLAPDVAILAAPPLAMNLLSLRPFQITVREQYQALVIPGLILAAIIGAARLWSWWQARSGRTRGAHVSGIQERRTRSCQAAIFMISAIGIAAVTNLAYRNPVATTVLYRESPERLAAMDRLAALIPPDAPLGVTSFLAPRMMPRRFIYYVPPDESFPPLERAEYLFIDIRAAALRTERHRDFIQRLRESRRWQVIAEEEDLLVLRQAHQAP
ncbi:DUF2079 domain-containing protein, partial [Roseiflexus castenholzii]|uniref:DUF2079 domain-containing protein n=1 Tax=Roseiflexus castenholzii TaxID=120962 RepID=UPI003C79FD8E